MQMTDLPQSDPTWPKSAQEVVSQLSTLILLQSEQLGVQSEQLAHQAQEITHLKERLNQNSKNSGKPPSSDQKQKKSRRQRGKSGRKKGGQKGHTGTTRGLLTPDKIEISSPKEPQCECGGEWIARGEIELFQVTELPEIKPEVTEYHLQTFECQCCGHKERPRYQTGLSYSRFGPRLHALVIDLSVNGHMTIRKIKSHLCTTFGVKVSVGAISDMLKRSATLSTQAYQELLSWFKADQSVKNVDETGWRIAGDRAALIGASNDHASLFAVSHHRRREDVVRLIGDDFNRVIISDRAKVYVKWSHRQLCWSHILRDFIFISEGKGSVQKGKLLVRRARRLFKLNELFRSGEINVERYLREANVIYREVDEALIALSLQPQLSWIRAGKVNNILAHKDQLWTFLRDPSLPIHNNAQEQQLRNPVIKRKLSFGSNTLAGGQFFAQLLSIVKTLERQGRDWRAWMIRSLSGATLSLIPEKC